MEHILGVAMKDYKDFFLLKGLSEDEISSVINCFEEPKHFSKGEIIYSEKNFYNAIGYIIKGKVRAITNNKNGIVIKTFSDGMSFGVAALFGEEKSYVSTLAAESDCVIQFVSEQTLKSIFERFPKTAINYITFLSERVRFLNKKLGIISCSSARDKVLKYLIETADEGGQLSLPENISFLAKSLGIGRTSFYRSIEELESKGIIAKENNIIRVNDYEKIC
ncbi:MAG: Crp/Fnr family transcriptional regulator [Clostridia bacterium]|nr:Crp/Fnr family transcriptional regulator [Clostridia bacterium]